MAEVENSTSMDAHSTDGHEHLSPSPPLAPSSPSLPPRSLNTPSPQMQKRREVEIQQEAITATALPGDPPLLPGELLTYIEHDITYLDPFLGPQNGSIYITDYKMYFKSTQDKEEPYVLNVPLGTISHIEKIGRSRSKGEVYGLEVHCKDLRNLKFAHKQEGHGRRGMYDRLQIVAFPASFGKNVFAYSYRSTYPLEDGWKIYDAEAELKRLGVDSENVPWRITRANEKFELCDTYPPVLGVPNKCTDEMIEAVAQFRSRGRIPALSWLHPVSHASITRSSQPLTGTRSKRSKEDEAFIHAIFKANKNSSRLYVMDARPKINAMANVAMGGGYESDEVYVGIDLCFLDIGNIHVMRESLSKLQEICYPDVEDQRWFSNLESTHWLDHIKAVLGGALRVAEVIERHKCSVAIHCSDGWDRTAQLSALAMIMLDPYYRTIRGFEVLIEKEWISFGHKFNQRIGHGERNKGDEQRSPVFLQFIDCVWQMTLQYPYAFEFNEHFLITILDHLYSCLFGTFLGNCEKARLDTKVRKSTISLWSFTNSQIEIYKNPLYADHIHQHVLLPSASIRKLQLWTGYYLRWNPRMKPQEPEFERCRQLQVLIKLLKEKCNLLQQEQKAKQSIDVPVPSHV